MSRNLKVASVVKVQGGATLELSSGKLVQVSEEYMDIVDPKVGQAFVAPVVKKATPVEVVSMKEVKPKKAKVVKPKKEKVVKPKKEKVVKPKVIKAKVEKKPVVAKAKAKK